MFRLLDAVTLYCHVGHAEEACQVEQSQTAQHEGLGADGGQVGLGGIGYSSLSNALQDVVGLADDDIGLLPGQGDVQTAGCRDVVFVVGRNTAGISFGYACLHVHGPAVAVIPVVVAIVAVERCFAIDAVQGCLDVGQGGEGLVGGHGSGRIQVEPALGTGGSCQGGGQEEVCVDSFHCSK